MNLRALIVGIAIMAGTAAASHAAIISGPTVDGLATFEDTATGLTWLELNDFFNESPQEMVATATAAGFTFADPSTAAGLVTDLPLGAGQWSSYAPIIGSAPNRQLFWAVYDPGPPWAQVGLVGDFFAYSNDTLWGNCVNCYSYDVIANQNTDDADMNIFAYQVTTQSNATPEPASLTVFSAGLFGLGLFRQRRRRSMPSR
jgi:hypothetical protein